MTATRLVVSNRSWPFPLAPDMSSHERIQSASTRPPPDSATLGGQVTPDFQTQVHEWSSPPVDHLNAYVSSATLLQMGDDELRTFVKQMEHERYNGWRNDRGLWRQALGLDSTSGARILDFGCGVGLEALQFAIAGNEVELADISADNLKLAARVLALGKLSPIVIYLVSDSYPFIYTDTKFDIFYCNGVLHHIWYPREIMKRAWEILKPGGECRLMVYTSQAWRNYVGTEPPEDTINDPGFWTFVRAFDQVGSYADWYSPKKVIDWFGDWFTLETWTNLTPWNNYAAVTLRRK